MRAIGLMQHGGPEVLELIEVPELKAEADEILVQVFCAAINPTDILARNGGIAERQKPYDPPYVPGMDISGKVVAIGENVKTTLKKGDAVMAMVIPNGQHEAYREKIALKSGAVDRITMLAYRRHIWFITFVLGAAFSPPDPLSLFLVSLPIILLFEIALLWNKFTDENAYANA